MKLTKFTQSCVLIETKDKRILVDPGKFDNNPSLLKGPWSNVDIVLVTHKHQDHAYLANLKGLAKNKNTKFFTTHEVAKANPEIAWKIIKAGDNFDAGDIKVEVVKAVHGFLPHFIGDKEIKENVGYIIDDGDKRVYLTSDTICFKNDYKCDILFVPICNHGIVMGPFEAARFAKATDASLVIPVHNDNPEHTVNLIEAGVEFKKENVNYQILKNGESIEI